MAGVVVGRMGFGLGFGWWIFGLCVCGLCVCGLGWCVFGLGLGWCCGWFGVWCGVIFVVGFLSGVFLICWLGLGWEVFVVLVLMVLICRDGWVFFSGFLVAGCGDIFLVLLLLLVSWL